MNDHQTSQLPPSTGNVIGSISPALFAALATLIARSSSRRHHDECVRVEPIEGSAGVLLLAGDGQQVGIAYDPHGSASRRFSIKVSRELLNAARRASRTCGRLSNQLVVATTATNELVARVADTGAYFFDDPHYPDWRHLLFEKYQAPQAHHAVDLLHLTRQAQAGAVLQEAGLIFRTERPVMLAQLSCGAWESDFVLSHGVRFSIISLPREGTTAETPPASRWLGELSALDAATPVHGDGLRRAA